MQSYNILWDLYLKCPKVQTDKSKSSIQRYFSCTSTLFIPIQHLPPFFGTKEKKNFRQEEKKSWQIFFGKLSLYILAWKGTEFMISFGTVTNQNVMTEVPVICYLLLSTHGHHKFIFNEPYPIRLVYDRFWIFPPNPNQ